MNSYRMFHKRRVISKGPDKYGTENELGFILSPKNGPLIFSLLAIALMIAFLNFETNSKNCIFEENHLSLFDSFNVDKLIGKKQFDHILRSSSIRKSSWQSGLKSLLSVFDRNNFLWYNNGVLKVNSLLTEQPASSTTNLSSQFSNSRDPSLIDYDAIDVYWRRDIEQEKGVWYSNIQPLHFLQTSNADALSAINDNMDAEGEQFERDLQLLTEKSLRVHLNEDDEFYDDLPKSHFAEYRYAGGKGLSDKENYCYDQPSTSGGCSSSLSTSSLWLRTNYLLPSTSKNYPYSYSTDSRASTSCQFNNNFESPPTRPDFGQKYKDLAIERNAANVPQSSSLEQNLNSEGCGRFGEVLLNDVSLSDATSEPLTGGVSEFFNFDQIDEGTENSTEQNTLSQIKEEEELPFGNLFDEGFIEPLSDLGLDSLILDEVLRNEPVVESAEEPREREINVNLIEQDIDIERTRYESNGSPSSGINSAAIASSPSHVSSQEEFSSHSFDFSESRLYDKLIPSPSSVHDQKNNMYLGDHDYAGTPTIPTAFPIQQHKESSKSGAMRRGRRSRDEQLAIDYNLPASAEAITRMTHAQIQHILRDPHFSTMQKTLVKKIRRRGRNKVAARKCRERRVNPDLFETNSRQQYLFTDEFSATMPSTSRQAYANRVNYSPPIDDFQDDDECLAYATGIEQNNFYAKHRYLKARKPPNSSYNNINLYL